MANQFNDETVDGLDESGAFEDLAVEEMPPVDEMPLAAPSATVEFPPFELQPVEVVSADAKGKKVVARTICIAVKRKKFGNKRKAKMGAVTVQADKALLSLSKTLLSSPELEAVSRLDSEMASYLKSICLKSMFKGGIYLLPIGLVKDAHEAMQDFATRREALVTAAVDAYETRVTETRARLDQLGDVSDYPTKEAFAGTFGLTWEFVTFDTPARLKEIDLAIFQDAQSKAQERLRVVADECETAMRAGMRDLVGRMVDRLTPGPDGKPKKFTKTLVSNMQEFLSTFAMKNVTDDGELAQLVSRARMVLDGVDATALRKDEALRAAVAGQFQQMQELMAGMVVDGATRMIDFGDDDEDGDGDDA